MSFLHNFSLETFGRSATLYVGGPLTRRQAHDVMDACGTLPLHVRHLRVDLRKVQPHDHGALRIISRGLRPWREHRQGSTRIDLPGAPVSFFVGAG